MFRNPATQQIANIYFSGAHPFDRELKWRQKTEVNVDDPRGHPYTYTQTCINWVYKHVNASRWPIEPTIEPTSRLGDQKCGES
jgi:hypothetical protein